MSKAGTASVFSTQGNAFTTRTASFIIQEHFPPATAFQPSGPLFGVQFSQLPCSDIKRPALPLGLSADPGSAPLYKNGVAVGGVGIEGDGLYTLDKDPADFDKPFEELVAVAAQRGFQPPDLIRGDNIIAGGVRLAYLNVTDADAPRPATTPFASLSGTLLSPVVPAQPSEFVAATTGGVSGAADTRFFPFVGSTSPSPNALTAADVQRIINQAAQQADITRAAIRQPLGSAARVSISVVDVDGNVLGIFRTTDAPVFGFDVSVQKARTAAFFSNRNAGALLRAAGFGSYVDRAAADGIRLDGAIAFSDRAGGALARPFYPDGLNPNPAGPFSREITEWSVFNDGLQIDLIRDEPARGRRRRGRALHVDPERAERHPNLPGQRAALQERRAGRRHRHQRRRRRPGRPHRRGRRQRLRAPRRHPRRPDHRPRHPPPVPQVPAQPQPLIKKRTKEAGITKSVWRSKDSLRWHP